MVRQGRVFGLWASCLASLGLVAAITAVHVKSVHDPHDGAVLRWLDKVGLVASNPEAAASMSNVTVYSINDTNAIVWLFAVASYFAGTAFLFSLLAEYHREDTLHLSIGYVFAAAAVTLMSVPLGAFLGVAAFAALLLIRWLRGRQELSGLLQ